MIRNSFQILPGVGRARERRIWESGVFTWREFIDAPALPQFTGPRKELLSEMLQDAEDALHAGEFEYLTGLLGSSGIWRIWPELADGALCIDIETDGEPAHDGGLTVAGFYSHGEYRPYVKGRGLSRDAVQEEFDKARLIVSFFGGGFDIPYLRSVYPGLRVDAPHFDLCPAGHRVGLRGGLKKVEKVVGITRADEVEGLGGFEAVLLWRAHENGRQGALDRLVSYNREDTENLHALAWIIYEKLRESTGLPELMANGRD